MSRATAVACLAVGLAAGVLLVPTGALSAAPSLVQLSDGTHTATISKAHQLLAAESDPANAVVVSAGDDGGCVVLYTVPKGKALVLKNATFNLQFTTQAIGQVLLKSGPNCNGTVWANDWTSGANGGLTMTDDLGSVTVLPAHAELDFGTSNLLYAYVVVRGYLIPAAAAPNGAHVVSHGSASVEAGSER